VALSNAGSPSRLLPSGLPKLTFGHRPGISLGSTLGQVRLAHGERHLPAADRWRALDGIIFVGAALRDPEPRRARSSRLRWGTFGDF
jgi:hypothetical protein